jgi:hypothetical protein
LHFRSLIFLANSIALYHKSEGSHIAGEILPKPGTPISADGSILGRDVLNRLGVWFRGSFRDAIVRP